MVTLKTAEHTAKRGERESLLVLSDVHLGSDLNDHSPGFGKRSQSVDDDLVKLLEHYREQAPNGDRWRVVIAGDFIDFIGIAIFPHLHDHELDTRPSLEELEHGLGNAADHAAVKLRMVAERHTNVFAALSRFVADGNALTIVHGNHDVEFHWDAVKEAFRAALLLHATNEGSVDAADHAEFLARIEFNPWFFYADGVAYIEHGHQYDAFCASDNVMAPLSPGDPRRIARGFCDILLRFVVRPTRGLREHGHERLGILEYIAFGMRLGFGGLWKLFTSFGRAVLELFRLRRAWFSDAAKVVREEHERRIKLLAEATRIGMDRLRALLALQVPPVTRSIRGIMASVLLDRLALGFLSTCALVTAGILGFYHGYYWIAFGSIVIAWFFGHRYLSQQRKLDPDDALVERAGRLVKLFPAAFVVMGHTHVPVKIPVGEGQATYINVGSWAEEEDGGGADQHYRAARTHLVIHPEGTGATAEFLTWDSALGPRRFEMPVVVLPDTTGGKPT